MNRVKAILGTALAVLLLAVNVLPASAATGASNTTSAGSTGLTIQPRKNYVINPGQTVTDKLQVGNLDTKDDLALTFRVIDFTYNGTSGSPKLNLDQSAQPTPWSLRPFMKLPDSMTVKAGQTNTFNFSISVPKTQGAGSYYSAILYQAAGGNSGNVALNASGVSLVFVSVPGTVNESLSLQKLGAYASPNSGTTGQFVYIATSAPEMIGYTLKNAGNVTESPAGSLTLKDMFGRQVTTVSKTNTNDSLALLGQTRLFATCIESKAEQVKLLGGTATGTDTTCVKPKLTPGRYTVSLDVFYGQNGNQTHEINATAHFWYLPWWFILALIVIVAVLTVVVVWAKRRLQVVIKGATYKGRK